MHTLRAHCKLKPKQAKVSPKPSAPRLPKRGHCKASEFAAPGLQEEMLTSPCRKCYAFQADRRRRALNGCGKGALVSEFIDVAGRPHALVVHTGDYLLTPPLLRCNPIKPIALASELSRAAGLLKCGTV